MRNLRFRKVSVRPLAAALTVVVLLLLADMGDGGPRPAIGGPLLDETTRRATDCDTITPGIQTSCNLWLMDPAFAGRSAPFPLPPADEQGCVVPESGLGCLQTGSWLFPADGADGLLGSWEEQLRFDHNAVQAEPTPDNAWLESGGRIASCSVTTINENTLSTGCTTTDDPNVPGIQPGPNGDGLIQHIGLIPRTNDLKGSGQIRPSRGNGITTNIVTDRCQAATLLGNAFPGTVSDGVIADCEGPQIHLRALEGDLDLDCDVDITDEQSIAFRLDAVPGKQTYDAWYDIAPEAPDGEIDILDLQSVFGRAYSTCQAPIPAYQSDPGPPPPPETAPPDAGVEAELVSDGLQAGTDVVIAVRAHNMPSVGVGAIQANWVFDHNIVHQPAPDPVVDTLETTDRLANCWFLLLSRDSTRAACVTTNNLVSGPHPGPSGTVEFRFQFKRLQSGPTGIQLLKTILGDPLGNELYAGVPVLTATDMPVPTATNTPLPTATYTPTAPEDTTSMATDCDTITPGIQTSCNLWLMNPAFAGDAGPTPLPPADEHGCVVPESGLGCLKTDTWLFPADGHDGLLGAWQEQVEFDHNLLQAESTPDNAWLRSGGRIPWCTVGTLNENTVLAGCTTYDDPDVPGIQPGPSGDGLVQHIDLIPRTNDLQDSGQIRPSRGNGITTNIVTDRCQAATLLGNAFPGTVSDGVIADCEGPQIHLRALEGDLDLDCDVDIADEQSIAFRLDAVPGKQTYDAWYDIAPEAPDGEIDILDLQSVFGRAFSTCQAPIPAYQSDPGPPPPPETAPPDAGVEAELVSDGLQAGTDVVVAVRAHNMPSVGVGAIQANWVFDHNIVHQPAPDPVVDTLRPPTGSPTAGSCYCLETLPAQPA